MAKLFISHASEDKDAFARPLADGLIAKKQEVWFDEYVLKVGDPLREKIDEGLRTTDFGVVILSKSFFAKKWPQDELEGLFALETKNRKLILPVWLNVTAEEVAQYSPILAGRIGARAEKGVAAVVEELMGKISASERTLEVSLPKKGVAALQTVSRRMFNEEKERKWLFSYPGVKNVTDAAAEIGTTLVSYVEEAGKNDQTKRFSARKILGDSLVITGPLGFFFQTGLNHMASNSASSAEYTVTFGRNRRQTFPPQNLPAEELEEVTFKPRLDETGATRWDESTGLGLMLTAAEVADLALGKLAEYIEQASAS